jgi:hypothetical protein
MHAYIKHYRNVLVLYLYSWFCIDNQLYIQVCDYCNNTNKFAYDDNRLMV